MRSAASGAAPSVVVTALLGVMMGVLLSRIGFSSFGELHKMLTFTDLRMLLTFGGAVVLLGLLTRLVDRQRPRFPDRPYHPGSIPGGLLFGCGWALCGACPSAVLIQVGEGQWLALWTLCGILLGNYAFALGQGKLFRFNPSGSCS